MHGCIVCPIRGLHLCRMSYINDKGLPKKMLKITTRALNQLREISLKNNSRFVRLGVKGGGCAGFEYEWTYANEETKTDIMLKDILLIDRMFELYLLGTELDYEQGDFNSTFVINNPKAKSSCGCGESFSI